MGREWVATLGAGEREITVTVVRRDGRLSAIVDGREVEVDARPVDERTISLLVGDQCFMVDLEGVLTQGGMAHCGGAAVPVRLEDARRKRLAATVGVAADQGGERLKAPIAGRVVKVMVAVGDVVAAGASVVVLEAMKMENEIKTRGPGVVEAVHTQDGESVESGQLLITLGPAPAS